MFILKKNAERRRQNRYGSNCQCWIEHESLTLLGKATNVSTSGLFLETLPMIETGARINIKVEIQDMGQFHATGTVKWRQTSGAPATDPAPEREKGKARIPGMGIEFSSITHGKDLLAEYISRKDS